MDEPIQNSNRIITHSVQDDKYEVIQVKVVDLNKKRKLEREEEEQLFFPLSKHQFGYRRSVSEQEQPSAEKSDENEVIIGQVYRGKVAVQLADESSILGSAKDSNSFVGGSAAAAASTMSWNPENENMLEVDTDHTPSIVSSGSSSSSLKDTLSSLHPRIAIGDEGQVVLATTDEPQQPNIKDVLQFGSGAQFSIDQLHQLEEHAGCICASYQVDGLEGRFDDKLEDILLYSNGPSEAEVFVLSSGRGNKDKDAEAAARRPTIDQEFEQHFSSLML